MSKFWDKVVSGTKEISDKTGSAIESGKTKLEISNLRKKISKTTHELGKIVVDCHEKGEQSVSLNDDEVTRLLDEIKVYRASIKKLEEKP